MLDNQHTEIYETETSDRAFEEKYVMVCMQIKSEGAGVAFDDANEAYTSRYTRNNSLALL